MERIEAGVKQGALKVLVADDDAPTRMLLRAAISQWGYEVIEAKDGEEAWGIMQDKAYPPRILILDWLMPKIDGITLAERIKHERKDYPYSYIILLTQKTGTLNVIKSYEAGADTFLAKPFDMAELRSRLFTGEKMIRYDNQFHEQKKQLQHYVARVEQLAVAMIDFKSVMNDDARARDTNVLNDAFDKLLERMVDLKKDTRTCD